MDASDQSSPQNATPPETPWQYTPGGQFDATQPAPAAPLPGANRPDQTVEWTASEFIAHHRGIGWYGALAGAAMVLAAIVFLITNDVVSVGAIFILTIIVGVAAGHKPRVITYRLDDKGLTVGRRRYPYGAFKAFSLVAEGAFESIVFTPLHRFIPPLSIYFAPEDEEKIISVLSSRLPLQPASQDFFDTLMRRARF